MLELCAFDDFPLLADPAAARLVLSRPLDVAECRTLSMVSFLNCVFVNARFEDSSGELVQLRWFDGRESDTVRLDRTALSGLVAKYERYLQAVAAADLRRGELELALWAFLERAHAERLVVVSRSTLYLQEYE